MQKIRQENENLMRKIYGDEWDFMNIELVFKNWVYEELGPNRFERIPHFVVVEDIDIYP